MQSWKHPNLPTLLLLACVSLPFFGQACEAQAAGASQVGHYLVFDLRTITNPEGETADPSRVFSIVCPGSECLPHIVEGCEGRDAQSVFSHLESLRATKPVDQKCLDALMKSLREGVPPTDYRWQSRKGDRLAVYVIENGQRYDVVPNEKDRNTRFATDLATLFKIAQNIAGVAGVGETSIRRHDYLLKRDRSTLSITVNVKKPGQAAPPAAPTPATAPVAPAGPTGDAEPAPPVTPIVAAPVSSEAGTELKAELITGPKEHFFFSADLPVNKVKELKYDSATGTLSPKEKPAKFLIGLDYMIGDLLSDNNPYWQGITFKLLAAASSTPKDTLGFGIGYRIPKVTLFGSKLDGVSIFAARVRYYEDGKAADGTVLKNDKVRYDWVGGLSFNLDKALDFLKK